MTDTVSFKIFVDSIPARFGDAPCSNEAELLEARKLDLMVQVSEITRGYMWSYESFGLQVVLDTDGEMDDNRINKNNAKVGDMKTVFPHLVGSVYFGDNIEDEWFITWILFTLSDKNRDISVCVYDGDGQFLLIEAADSLPNWLNEGNAGNRIWIRHGVLHVIPIPRTPAELVKVPSLLTSASAIAYLKSSCVEIFERECDSLAFVKNISDKIMDKLSVYPSVALEHSCFYHNAILPVKVAHIFSEIPEIVTLAVDSFYLRDSTCMNDAIRLAYFQPIFQSSELVACRIRFTRNSFAKLMYQPFHAPKHYKMPPVEFPYYTETEVGMKLTCALEILLQKSIREKIIYPVLKSECNYLLEPHYSSTILKKMHHILLENNHNYLSSVSAENISSLPANDSDSWLHLSSASLDEVLGSYDIFVSYFIMSSSSNDNSTSVDEILHGIKGFVKANSDVDGVVSKATNTTIDNNLSSEILPQEIHLNEELMFNELKKAFDGFSTEEIKLFAASLPENISNMLMKAKTQGLFDNTLNEFDNSNEEDDEDDEVDIDQLDMDDDDLSIAEQMENELGLSKALSGFERYKESSDISNGKLDDKSTTPLPINLDFNLVKNILDSFEAQEGSSGPASNILSSLGIKL